MVWFSTPYALLLLIPLIAFTFWVWHTGRRTMSARRRRASLLLRLLLLVLVVLGLSGIEMRLPQNREAVAFVADLSASDSHAQDQIINSINRALRIRPTEDEAGVVSFARDAEVEQPASPLKNFEGFQSPLNTDYSNLESGLELGGAILPDGYRRRAVIFTDGRQNAGDALSAARLLRQEGVRVDVAPIGSRTGPEVLVDAVNIPSQLRPQEEFHLQVSLYATVTTVTRLDVFRDRTLVISRQEQVHAGENVYAFPQRPLKPGFHSYRVDIAPAEDTQVENNQGSAVTEVSGPPRVLVIAAQRSEATNVVLALHTTGIAPHYSEPSQVVPSLTYLEQYAAIVIVDTPAADLGMDLMSQLLPYVRDLGHGLVVIGGQNAYGMGGYGQTPLEQALPVRMDLPRRKDLPTVAVVLIIESLEGDEPINISKEAGKGVVNLLSEQDQVAVNDTPDDGTSGWVVPMQHVRNKAAIDTAIDQMYPGDPVSYDASLLSAYQLLKQTRARIKHIILLGDGDAEDSNDQRVVEHIHAGGVTISTVATNGMGYADYHTMQSIARWGGGRYYRADDPSSIPKIFLREARTVARSGIVLGRFYPQELSASPMLRDLHRSPPLFGYVATTPKPTGEIILASPKLDPVLSGWQLGLGRAVAWTSDAAGLWTSAWVRSPQFNRFWSDVVGWTLPAGGRRQLFVSASTQRGVGKVSVTLPASLGPDPSASAQVLDPQLHAHTVELAPDAPGHYQATFDARSQGGYFITLEARGAGHADVGQVGLDVPYSPEYRSTGVSMHFLRELAAAGGGAIIHASSAVWSENLPAALDRRPLTDWLWLLALLLLPVDVALRRLVLDRRDLVALVAAVRSPRRESITGPPLLSSLATVRTQRERRKQTLGSPAPHTAGTPIGDSSSTPPAGEEQPVPAPIAQSPAPESSTVAQLLTAKRRRQ